MKIVKSNFSNIHGVQVNKKRNLIQINQEILVLNCTFDAIGTIQKYYNLQKNHLAHFL